MDTTNYQTIQQTVDSIFKWTSTNKMNLNIQKTKSMVINPEFQPQHTLKTLTLNDHDLEQVNNYKNLGSHSTTN